MSEQLLIQKSTLVDIADTIRAKTGLTGEIKISDITPENEEIMSNFNLPSLSNPADASDIRNGKEVFGENGTVIVGEMPIGPGMEHEVSIDENGLITSNLVFVEEGFVSSGEHEVSKQLPTQSAKTITPSTTEQVAVESGKYTTGEVKVAAIPVVSQATPNVSINEATGLITATVSQDEGYVEEGTKSATKQLAFQPAKTITPSTTSQIAVSSGYYTGGDITIAAVPTQSKSVTPTSAVQNITPDSGKFLSKITVAAIPSTYVKPISTKAATTYTPTTTNQTISAGTYCSGVQTIKGDSNLKAENIKSGVSIFGVSGTAEVGGGGSSDGYENEDLLITRNLTNYTNSRVSSIGSYAFYRNVSLVTVSFPAAKLIRDHAFQTCYSLTTVSFPAVTEIETDAFYSCSKLTSINFPSTTMIR